MSALILSAVVREVRDTDGKPVLDIAVTEDHHVTRRRRAAKRWGAGAMLRIRVEPADEAYTYGQLKHLYGHLYAPVAARTGETVAEVNVRMKVAFFPEDGRTSLTELNREELKSFTESVEQDIRENDPDSWDRCLDAMALYERRTA